jgi:pyridoxamine 5'-phosphate oxidase
MNKDEIRKFLNEHPASFFATTEGDQPRVRGMGLVKADEKGLLYQTSDVKDVWNQVVNNAKVEACFNDLQANIQIRVTGTVEIIEDQAVKEEIVVKRPFLKPLVEKRGYGPIKVFRVTKCKAYVWTMETNFAPKEFVDL